MNKILILLGFAVVLASCSSPEFRQEEGVCTANFMRQIPPRFEQEMYNQIQSRQVPTGQTFCSGFGNMVTCNQTMRTEYYSVPAVRTVDRNKSRRDAQRVMPESW
jgi:hypothetical protein